MATQDLEKLVVQLSADFKAYERSMAKAQNVTVRELRKVERQAETSLRKVEGVFKRFSTGLLAGAGITGIATLGQVLTETISGAAKIGDLADKIGISTDALQGLQYGAVQADLSFEDLEKSLLKFSKTLGEAANGQGEYLKTLRANGLELRGNFFDNLKQLADLVQHAKNEQEAFLLVTQAMGKGASGMLEFLRDGSAGFVKFGTDAANANAVIEGSAIRTAQKIDDRWAALMQSLSQMTKKTVIDIADIFNSLGSAPGAEKILDARARILQQGTRFGNGQAPASRGPVAGTGPEFGRPPVGTNLPTTKIFNPEEEAERKRNEAEADREAAQAKRELNRERDREAQIIKQNFDAFTGELTRADEDVAALKLEAETLGLTTAEIERQRVAQELLNAANREGVPLTDSLNQVIQTKAKAYGDAAQALEDLHVKEAKASDINDSLKESFSSFVGDIRSGVEPIEALTNALGRLADRLLDLAFDNIFNSLLRINSGGGGGIGGAISALVSHSGGIVGQGGPRRMVHPAAFAGARRMHRGGIAGDEEATILQKGEIVLPKGFRGGGAKVINNIITPPGTKAETKTRSGGSGVQINDIIISTVNRGMLSGKFDKAQAARFGNTPQQSRR